MTVTVDFPAHIERELRAIWGEAELPRKVLESLVIEAYRQGLISRDKVGELLGMAFSERETFLKERDVPGSYDLQGFEEELRTIIREFLKKRLEQDPSPLPAKTFEEILAPLQQDFEASGMTEEELGDLIDAEIADYRAERRARKQPVNG